MKLLFALLILAQSKDALLQQLIQQQQSGPEVVYINPTSQESMGLAVQQGLAKSLGNTPPRVIYVNPDPATQWRIIGSQAGQVDSKPQQQYKLGQTLEEALKEAYGQ